MPTWGASAAPSKSLPLAAAVVSQILCAAHDPRQIRSSGVVQAVVDRRRW
jgi:hypothetical protein